MSDIADMRALYLLVPLAPLVASVIVGLWGPKIRAAFEDMGVMGFAEGDIDQLIAEDETIAEEIDQQRLAAVRAVADSAES